MYKIILGMLMGVFIFLLSICLFKKFILTEEPKTISIERNYPLSKNDSLKINSFFEKDLDALRIHSAEADEKISSLNKRIDDFYIFVGIIITLLLAINVGVFVNAERQVDKYFKEHFDTHLKKITDYSQRAESAVSKIEATRDLTEKMKKSITETLTPPN